jgi:Amt family ammonium transporter
MEGRKTPRLIETMKSQSIPEILKNRRISLPKTQTLSRVVQKISPAWLGCIPLAAIITVLWHSAADAQTGGGVYLERQIEDVATSLDQLQGFINVGFVLFATTLVVFMNAGFGMLEVGMCRQKNAVNILTKNLVVFGIAILAYWSIGFSFMFGAQGNSFIGWGGFFLSSGDSATYGLSPFPENLPVGIFFLFQAAFAATAATIVSGAVAERIRLDAFLIFSFLIITSYTISGHWAWGSGGWLQEMGFTDFAGTTVVHSCGAWAALVGAIMLGPRIGKYNADGSANTIAAHNFSLATLGALILWLGWFGFNPGSQLALDSKVSHIAITTNLAGSTGAVVALIVCWIKDNKKVDLGMVINGLLAGLVAITGVCNDCSFAAAIIIGAIGGVLVVFSVGFFDSIKIDDPVGAISVHLVNGAWGTLAVGIFGSNAGFQQIMVQLVGIVAIGAFSAVMSTIFWLALKATIGIRVHEHEEIEGLDLSEHGQVAYAGFALLDEEATGEAQHLDHVHEHDPKASLS